VVGSAAAKVNVQEVESALLEAAWIVEERRSRARLPGRRGCAAAMSTERRFQGAHRIEAAPPRGERATARAIHDSEGGERGLDLRVACDQARQRRFEAEDLDLVLRARTVSGSRQRRALAAPATILTRAKS